MVSSFKQGLISGGLVLNEAMASGVPCIASKYACAVKDLIKNENVGFVMDYSETDDLVQAVEWLLDNPEAGLEVGKKASQFIAEYASLAKSSAGFVKAIQHSMRKGTLQPA